MKFIPATKRYETNKYGGSLIAFLSSVNANGCLQHVSVRRLPQPFSPREKRRFYGL
jgi:hypothetical protein